MNSLPDLKEGCIQEILLGEFSAKQKEQKQSGRLKGQRTWTEQPGRKCVSEEGTQVYALQDVIHKGGGEGGHGMSVDSIAGDD